jgi:hypothetical protein
MTGSIVPSIDEAKAKETLDRLMGGLSPLIKGCIEAGDLTGAVIMFSTSEGKIAVSMFDRAIPADTTPIDAVTFQASKIAMSNMATMVATTLAKEVQDFMGILKPSAG